MTQMSGIGPLRAALVLGLSAALSSVLSPTPALAMMEGKPPVIGAMSSGVGGEITVGANINPEGLETTYEIRLECPTTSTLPWSCEPMPNQWKAGQLAASYESREVTLTLTGLQPGSYWFGVLAVNAAGKAFRRSDILKIPVPLPGACPNGCSTNEPYKSEISQSALESANSEAAKIAREVQEERQAKEQEELKAREVDVRANDEAALKRRENAARARTCTVPSLTGDSLSAARRALTKARCRMGKITQPAHHHTALLVTHQSPRHGRIVPRGTTVSVTLAAASVP